jgi:hypothetical protein
LADTIREQVLAVDPERSVYGIRTIEVMASALAHRRLAVLLLVAQIEFLEWTGENHLQHTKFIELREDKTAREVRRE